MSIMCIVYLDDLLHLIKWAVNSKAHFTEYSVPQCNAFYILQLLDPAPVIKYHAPAISHQGNHTKP